LGEVQYPIYEVLICLGKRAEGEKRNKKGRLARTRRRTKSGVSSCEILETLALLSFEGEPENGTSANARPLVVARLDPNSGVEHQTSIRSWKAPGGAHLGEVGQ